MRPALFLTRPFLLLSLQFLAVASTVAVFFPLQGYLAAMGVPASAIGFILGADALSALVAQLLITPFVTARTARRWLLSGALMLTIALLLEGTITDAAYFVAARLLQGVGFVCVMAALTHLLVLCIPAEMSGRAFSWISLVRLVPFAVIPPLFGLMRDVPAHLGAIIRWSSLLSIFAGLLIWLLPLFPQEKEGPQPSGNAFSGVGRSLADRNVAAGLSSALLLYAGYSTVFFFLRGFALKSGLGSPGLFFTIATLAMMAVRLLLSGGAVFDRFDKRRMNVLSLALSGLAVFLLPFSFSKAAFLALAVPCGLGWGAAMPLMHALIFDVSQSDLRGLNQNLTLLMMQAGYFAGPALAGSLLAASGYGMVFAGACGMLLLASALLLMVRKKNICVTR